MAKRIVTKIGDVFCVEVDGNKRFFQYICNDLCCMGSSVIRAFNRFKLKQVKKIALIMVAAMCLSSCDDEAFKVYEDVYEYPFYNETADTVYVYDSRSHYDTDTITASQAIAQYAILQRIAPHGMTHLFVSGESLYRYGETGVSQIMVFRQTTLESHTLKEIADENIYDALYIYPWTQMVTPGFEVRYDGESQLLYGHDSESHNSTNP